MRKVGPYLAIALMVFIFAWLIPANATDQWVESIATSDGGSKLSSAIVNGSQFAFQCNADARYRSCTSSSCYAVATDALIPGPGGSQNLVGPMFDVKLPGSHRHVAITPTDGGGVTCQFFRVLNANGE